MKLVKLRKLLLEVGDLSNIESYPFNVTGLNTEFKTELGIVKVEFQTIKNFRNEVSYPPVLVNSNNIIGYNILYTLEGEDTQFKKMQYTFLIKVLKTVTDIIIKTILKNDSKSWNDEQNIYCIGSISKLGRLRGDKQKDMIYRQIAGQNLPDGYRVSEIKFKDVNIDGIAITKNKKD